MPNWNANLTVAELDKSGTNANINLTIVITNSVTGEVQTRIVPSNGLTANTLKGLSDQYIAALNARDSFYPMLQGAAGTQGGFPLSSG
jgi:hypothetical protein